MAGYATINYFLQRENNFPNNTSAARIASKVVLRVQHNENFRSICPWLVPMLSPGFVDAELLWRIESLVRVMLVPFSESSEAIYRCLWTVGYLPVCMERQTKRTAGRPWLLATAPCFVPHNWETKIPLWKTSLNARHHQKKLLDRVQDTGGWRQVSFKVPHKRKQFLTLKKDSSLTGWWFPANVSGKTKHSNKTFLLP